MARYYVYMLAPVNVRVEARSAAQAKKVALKAVAGQCVQIADDESEKAIVLDSGTPWVIDPNHAEPVKATTRGYEHLEVVR